MNERDIYLRDLEEEWGKNVFSHYLKITKPNRYISLMSRTIQEFEEFIPLFAEYGVYNNISQIELQTIDLLNVISGSILFHRDWIILLEKWFEAIQKYSASSETHLQIMIRCLCELVIFYDIHKDSFNEYEDLQYLNERLYNLLYKLITGSVFKTKDFLFRILERRNFCSEGDLYHFLFEVRSQFNVRLRNHILFKYILEERANSISFHTSIHNMRQRVLFEDDFKLYHNIILISLGLSRLIDSWQMKRKVRYISNKIRVIQELKSLYTGYMGLHSFLGGEDYLRAIKNFSI
jgi:hypothetical protein